MPRTKRSERKKVMVSIQPNIGLDASVRLSVVEMLNLLLADETALLFKTRRAKLPPGEEDISAFHLLYAAHHKEIERISNEIRERIQILGGMQTNNTEKLVTSTRLDENTNGLQDIINILADQEAFIRFLRDDAQKCSELYEDQGTYAMLISFLRAHEKMAWLLRSQISHEAI